MSQAQSQSKPPPLRDVLHHAEADEKAEDKFKFYEELYATEQADAAPPPAEEPPPAPEPASAPATAPAPIATEVRASYRRTDDNVYRLDGVWQNAPAHRFGKAKSARPRPARHPKPVLVRKRYRVGKAVATLFAMIGWLMILAAAAVSSIWLLQPVLVAQFGAPNLLGGVAASLFVGLLTVSIGLAARAQFDATRAQFDQADAARELVALERARAGVAHC